MLASCMLLLLLLTATSAEATTIRVVNDVGVPQAGVRIADAVDPGASSSGYWAYTDATGQASWTGALDPGDTVYATRDANGVGACAAPEGAAGQPFKVRSIDPAEITITLPAVSQPAFRPLSDDERGVIGYINQKRAQLGYRSLYVSRTLSGEAQSYAGQMPDWFGGAFAADVACQQSGPLTRAIDGGWPLTEFAGPGALAWNFGWNWSYDWSAANVAKSQAADPGSPLLAANSNAVGIGHSANKWYFEVGDIQPTDLGYRRAQIISDAGDAALLTKGSGRTRGAATTYTQCRRSQHVRRGSLCARRDTGLAVLIAHRTLRYRLCVLAPHSSHYHCSGWIMTDPGQTSKRAIKRRRRGSYRLVWLIKGARRHHTALYLR